MERLDKIHTWEEICQKVMDKVVPDSEKKGFKDWFMNLEYKKYCFDPLMYLKCYYNYKKIRNDFDNFTVIIGGTGIGKSVLSLLISANTSPSFRLLNIAYHYKSLAIGLKDRQKYDTYLLDEGALILHSADRTDEAMKLEKLGTIMRQFNLNIIINLPDLLLLRRYFRDMRINTLIWVKSRGKYRAYSGKAIKIILHYYRLYHGDMEKIKIPDGTFWDGYFNNLYPEINDITEVSYRKLKEENADEFINDMYQSVMDKEEDKNTMLSLKEAKKIVGLDRKTIISRINDGTFEGKKIGGKWFVNKESLIKQ